MARPRHGARRDAGGSPRGEARGAVGKARGTADAEAFADKDVYMKHDHYYYLGKKCSNEQNRSQLLKISIKLCEILYQH